MPVQTSSLTLPTQGKGTYEITAEISRELSRSGLQEGTVTVFCQHTSCSLVIMENADPSARRDLEMFFEKLVPEGDPDFIQTLLKNRESLTAFFKRSSGISELSHLLLF